MMVMAMMMAATSQPNAIQAPPIKIQSMFSRMETGCMTSLARDDETVNIGAGERRGGSCR